MLDAQKLTTSTGLVFDAWIEGPTEGEPVILLHGFPQSRHAWRAQVPALARAGFRVLAPDQRGYSRGARPDPGGLSDYSYDRVIGDVIDMTQALGIDQRRFHLVGHDWGAQIAWGVADRHPDRLASLTILSRPHPSSFFRALDADDGDQRYRSRHHRAFLSSDTARLWLEDNARRLREGLGEAGVTPSAVEDYVGVLGNEAAMEAALACYRSAQAEPRIELGKISVPTLYIWGDADAAVGRPAAEGTAEFVSGPFQFEEIPGVGHFITDQVPDRVTELLLTHLERYPA